MVCIFLSWNKKWYWPVTLNETPAAWFHQQTNLWRSASSVFSYLWRFLLPETWGTKRLTVVPNVSLTHWGNLSNLMEMSGVHNCVLALGSLDCNDRSHLGLLVVLLEAAEWTVANRRLGSREIPAGEANVVLIWSSPAAAAAAAKLLQLCPTLRDPIDGSPPGSPIPGILQARTLEWVAISISSAWKWNCSVMCDSATPQTAAHQAPLPMGFSRQEYWSGLPLPSPVFPWTTSTWAPEMEGWLAFGGKMWNSIIGQQYLVLLKDKGPLFCCLLCCC